PGEVVGIVGANESGKSSLCLVAAGLAPSTIGGRLEGSVMIDDLATAKARPYELAQRCGSLFQNPATQLSGTAASVWEEVAFGPRNLGLSLDDVVARVDEATALLGIGDLVERSPARLSGGQAQLVALAGVVALRPAYLILDEPTSQLDPQGTRLVGDTLTGLAGKSGVGILIVEHKTDLVARIATRVGVAEGGRLVALGPSGAILGDERLGAWGVEPPSSVRLARAAALAGVSLG
ncbi:MAG: energy-coupling factor ABC transporter ATP-binding protein, partial [Candidatus Limnocylindrales bacterium]